MIRGVGGIIVGLIVWGILWAALNSILPFIFPEQFAQDGITDNAIMKLFIILFSFDFSFLAGYLNAIMAKAHELRFALLQGFLQLAAGIYVYQFYWDKLPLWYHPSFLMLILPGVMAGAIYCVAAGKEHNIK